MRAARRSEHLLFNLKNFNFFRKSEGGNASLFFGHSRLLTILIAVPYVIGSELAFFRESRYFVELKRQVVGIFVLREEPDALYVGSLGVAPEYRRFGVATHILDYSTRVASRLGKKWVELTVLRKNIRALRLYEMAGFVKKEERKWSFILRRKLMPTDASANVTQKVLNNFPAD